MKKRLIISVLIATGLAAQAQTLLLSDNFDTGGVATNDLNYNLAARQAGTLAPRGYTHTTNASSLTAAGRIQMASYDWGDGLDWVDLSTNLVGVLGANNFSFSMDCELIGGTDWFSMYMRSATGGSANFSVMSFLSFATGDMQVFYGTASNGVASQVAGLSLATIQGYIPGFDVQDEHNYEFVAYAETSHSGYFNFKIDGITFVGGLPYDFVDDAVRTIAWISPGNAVSEWDNLSVSLVPDGAAPPYVFFDDFNAPDADNANAGYITRQSNGLVQATYNAPTQHEIVDGKLNVYGIAQFANLSAEFASHIVGEDFEFSVEVSENNLGSVGDWFELYMIDGTTDAGAGGDARVSSRFGLGFPHNDQGVNPWSFSIIYGTGAAREVDSIFLPHYKGDFDKQTDPFTLKLVSTAGVGGTNTVEIYVSFDGGTNFIEVTDGVLDSNSNDPGVPIPDYYTYYFDGPERQLHMVGIFAGAGKDTGIMFDDLSIKVIEGLTYEDWVADWELTGSDTNRTADIENGGLGDGMDNLLEYALGGNPLVDDAASILPVLQFPDGDTLEYLYRRRNDAATRGLTYDLQAKGDLVADPWTSTGGAYETGSSAIDGDFDLVTNTAVITNIPVLFLNLEVTEN